MNVLVNKFPTKTVIDGKEYNLCTDFRVCLKIILAFEDKELLDADKIEVLLENLYGADNIPVNLEKAVEKAVLFLDCGEVDEGKATGETGYKLYSFSQDAKYIYSAIKQTHGIDLENIEYLHWWKFVYLFLDLNPECFFCKMLDLRNKKKKGKLSKEEQAIYLKLFDILELDNEPKYSEEEQAQIDKFKDLINMSESEVGTENEVK